jgi:hypothetical protein
VRIFLQFIITGYSLWLASLVPPAPSPMPPRLRAARGGTVAEAIGNLMLALDTGRVLEPEPELWPGDHLADARIVDVFMSEHDAGMI